MFKKLISGVLLASVALTAIVPAASAAVEGKGDVKSNKDAVGRLVGYSDNNRDRLSTLITAATCDYFDGAVVGLLATTPKVTLFAPTNYAFRKLGQNLGLGSAGIDSSNVCSVDEVLGVKGALFTILGYHVVTPKIWYKQAKAARGVSIPMFTGELAEITGSGNGVRIDGAKVVVKNIRSKNGIAHVINDVMVPPSIEAALAR
jgi:uncharacterized surface protein with fasciclin (FAS1) repeats